MPQEPLSVKSRASRTSPKDHTIRDIARLSGFSRSTVSLVLNGDSRIRSSTRERVWEVIERVGYEPNCMARSLARRRSMIVAVVVPKVAAHVFSDYYFSESISGISDTLSSRGYRMIIERVTDAFLEEATYLRLFRERQIDGMLLVGTLDSDGYVDEVLSGGNKAVLVNSWRPGCSCVVADNFSGARQLVAHLCSFGHSDIGFIGGLNSTTVGLRRDEGYRQGLADCGLKFAPEYVQYGDFSEQSGYEATGKLLARRARPTAIFACNDMMAIGCMKRAEEMGISVPGELAVVGADDIALCSYVRPRLTTLRQPMFDIGKRATELLLSGLTGTCEWPNEKMVPTTLVVRESCGSRANAQQARSGAKRRAEKLGSASS